MPWEEKPTIDPHSIHGYPLVMKNKTPKDLLTTGNLSVALAHNEEE
jgi:hypothetical protein